MNMFFFHDFLRRQLEILMMNNAQVSESINVNAEGLFFLHSRTSMNRGM